MSEWVVIVDDEALSLTNAKNILSAEGMKISCLRSGQDLLKFTEKNQPDLILLDIIMPEMDGFATFRELRKKEEQIGRIPTPVIFLTGDGDTESERRGLTEGASDFIKKPFNREILISRIQKTLQNRKTLESLLERASTDKLTGFLNKSSGTEKISKLCENEDGALMIVDLDSFKSVNDIYGHDMGDMVLQGFARILKENLREKDVLSRIGGDEFLIFARGLLAADNVKNLIRRLNHLLDKEAERLLGEDYGIPLGISAGVVFVPDMGRDYKMLFQFADSSLYRVKQNGKHACEVYSPLRIADNVGDDLENEMARITHMVEERGIGRGALLLGQEAFSCNYRFIMRFAKRNRLKASRLLFVIDATTEDLDLNTAMISFGEVMKQSLRKYDIIFRSRHNSYYLLLPELNESDVMAVVERIRQAWKETKYADCTQIRHFSESFSFAFDEV